MTVSSEELIDDNRTVQRHNIAGWNDNVKHLHTAAREAYLLWIYSVKPRHGIMFECMTQARRRFKYALRKCKTRKNAIIADKIACKLAEKNDKDVWREVKMQSNCNIKLSNAVGDAHGANEISAMWQEQYATLFISVNGSGCKDLHDELCNE